MAINIEMPKLSDTMTEGTLVSWKKAEGDSVEMGDIIAEIETDKATMEMEAFDDGTMAKIIVQEGGKAPVGELLAILAEEDESVEDAIASAGSAGSAAPAASAPAAEATPTAASTATAAPTTAADGSRLKVSPLAKKLAAEKGVDLTTLKGTGAGGRIVKDDVLNAPAGGSAPAAAAPVVSAAPAIQAINPVASGEDQKLPVSSMRKIIAERLLTSKVTIPHFYLHVEVNAGELMNFRKLINSQAENTHGNKYTFNDFILKAVINASLAVPAVNASYAGDHIVQYANVGVSVAIAVEDGLVTPVVKQAQTKSLLQISKEVKDMAGRARDKKLRPDEFDGGTVTVSNLGSYGIDSFDAIVNPPQAAIISVGGIIEKPIVKNGEIVPGKMMNIGLSCDHRVVDGAVGAQFLNEIKKLLENPALMLV